MNVGDILNYAYTGEKAEQSLLPGRYRLEVWGAQGGYINSSTYGGKGGFSTGELTLAKETTLYVYVGGAGNTSGQNGGFNGGGKRKTRNGGGGATDIRVGADDLYARVIVAGGGGSYGASSKTGMYGGGESGGSSTESYGTGGYGGTQTGVSNSSWQTTEQSTSVTTQAGAYAGFGFGGNGISANSGAGGAGGGGWYGGSGAYPDSSSDDDRGGGGGSGWVWTGKNAPTGFLLDAAYQLANASTTAGNVAFTGPTGSSETGHSGNGYARITVLELFPLVPDVPENFRQTAQDYFSIGLAWDAVECTGYHLYRDGELLATLTGTAYTDTGVSPNSSYTYTLTAYNDEGDSDPATLIAKTTEGYAVRLIEITSATIDINPCVVSQEITVTVMAEEIIKVLSPEIIYSGEFYANEV